MSIGIWQLILILVIVLIIFGGGKIPRLMGDFGKGIKTFKKEIKSDKVDESSEADSSKKSIKEESD